VSTFDVVVLASGRGTNFAALCDAIDSGRCEARVVALVTDRRKAGALGLAEARGIEAHVVHPRDHATRDTWNVALAERVAAASPALVVLAGFMRIVGAPLLERFEGRIINVHPSLLPAFPGIDGPGQALAAGAKISGCTVHRVDAGVDSGEILAQAAVPILPTDDAEALHARIQKQEHRLLPAVVDLIARGQLDAASGRESDVLLSPRPPEPER
jgi:phosphoribosylglycinamide formyltransferase-1